MSAGTFATLDDLEDPCRVLARVDLNSPVENGHVCDNRRFDLHARTIRELAGAGHRLTLLAHQGRPGDEDFVSLAEHAEILTDHLDRPVEFCPEITGPAALEAIDALESGEILLLENVRMDPDELADRTPAEHARSDLVRTLADTADAYVGDAYSTAHRGHASIVGLPTAMNAVYAGRVMEMEYTATSSIQSRSFDGPVVMILGGRKAGDLFRVMRGVEDSVDHFLLGGVIGELFLRARGEELGYDVGEMDLYDALWEEHADTIQTCLAELGDRLVLPVDLAYLDEAGERVERPVDGPPKANAYRDIGRGTVARFTEYVDDAAAVFVKGALGVFEDHRFSDGTVEILEAIAATDAFSVVGGGDTARALDMYDLDPADFDHVSIAGGAYVSSLAGEPLPGVEVLRKRSVPSDRQVD